MKSKLIGKSRTVAVLGSIAALGGGATALAATSSTHAGGSVVRTTNQSGGPAGMADLSTGELTALESVHTAIAADTTSIATPILDKAVSDGTITAAEEQDLLALLAKGPIGPGPGDPGMHPPRAGAPPTASS